jgi:hypothetical protein
MVFWMSLFFLALALSGGLIILLSRSNAQAARLLPLAFAMLFAGLGYCILALILYPLAFYLGNVWGFALVVVAPFVAALIGALVGYRAGRKRAAKS